MIEHPSLGFIGLGAMGHPIASRLLAHVGEVAVFDTRAAAGASLANAGAISCASPAEVAERAEVVFLSLPQPHIVTSVLTGADGLLKGGAVRVIVDFSTIGPAAVEAFLPAIAARGVDYLDAPVSGGPAGAREGRLSVMLAGTDHAVETAAPFLEVLAGKVIRVGSTPGQAQYAKVINNMMSATSIAITAEALALGVKAGLEPVSLLTAINASSGRNTASADKFPQSVLTRSFDFGFSTELMVKDITLCLDEAKRHGSPMPVGALVQQLWSICQMSIGPRSDCTEFARLIESWAGVTIESSGELR